MPFLRFFLLVLFFHFVNKSEAPDSRVHLIDALSFTSLSLSEAITAPELISS